MAALLVHIGAGKTGTTSIQNALDTHRESLLEEGVVYLGHMLNHASAGDRFRWQQEGQAEHLLHKMTPHDSVSEIHSVLSAELERLNRSGVRFGVWSNEALFARRDHVLPALKMLSREGADVRIVLYVRRHDAWAKSAYAQWGIRHKSYEGPTKPFSEWIKERPVHFAEGVKAWDDAFDNLLIRNYDHIGNVTEDFFSIMGVKVPKTERIYETPPAELLIAWAVFNARFSSPALPSEFSRVLSNSGFSEKLPPRLPEPGDLLPSDTDMEELLRLSADDIAEVNKVLAKRGADQIDATQPVKGAEPPSDWRLTQLLMQMLFSCQEEIMELRRRIEMLER